MSKKQLPVAPAGRPCARVTCETLPSALDRWNGGIKAAATDDNSISVFDVIGQDYWGEGVTAKRIAGALRAMNGADVTVNINSPGGDMFEGLAIYNLLREYQGKVTVKVLGIAASAASVIAMAGDDIQIGRGAFLMIHNCWVVAMGTGVHLHGIVPQASAFSAEFRVEQQNGIDDLRLAMLQAQLARFPASGHVLHFIDWAKIELTKDTLGRYILANPSGLTGPTLWGLPVVATEAAAFKGKFLTGAFNAGAQIFDREDANVVISTENADDFEKNMISIRCEERLALAVKRPEAFIYGSFTVPAPAGA